MHKRNKQQARRILEDGYLTDMLSDLEDRNLRKLRSDLTQEELEHVHIKHRLIDEIRRTLKADAEEILNK